MNADQIKTFQKEILSWYAENQRDLPWRKTRDPYSILISEVMSQQTQLSRVIPKYETWMKALPTVSDVAKASTTDVLTLWSGLGYNRRALYLQKAAQEIVSNFHGEFPNDEKILQTLPGVGEYTARAIICFAFDKQVAVVDTNVRKVILTEIIKESRSMNQESWNKTKQNLDSYFLIHASVEKVTAVSEKDIRRIADQLLPHGRAYEWNQALMDYSAAMLKKEKIPIPRQSKFKDSDRYYRGQIIKFLIKEKKTTDNQLHDYFNEKEETINKERLKRVIDSLLRDKLVEKSKGNIILP
jgi:A/G-specific adenine glycosylase